MHSDKTIHDGPMTGLIPYWIGRFWMWLFGWDVVGQVPPGEKFVVIGSPHTSNWDFPFALTALYVFRLKLSWMGKHTLFRKPFGFIFRWLGGIAIDRRDRHDVVKQMAKQFENSRKLAICIAPAGTRSKRDHWKSGFYWIAYTAQVPIICGYLDYEQKKACLGLSFVPTGAVKDDMDRIREFYEGIHGKHPELETEIRLK